MAGFTRATVGFQGGPVLAIRLSANALKALEQALGGSGWHDVEHEEGTARIRLDQVVYVQIDSAEPRVGFG